MSKYKKKFVNWKVNSIIDSQSILLIGQYDNSQFQLWKELKSLCDFYVPKNSRCFSLLNQQCINTNPNNPQSLGLDFKLGFSQFKSLKSKNFIEGPVFFLWEKHSNYGNFHQALIKLHSANVVIFGGFIDNKLLTFGDAKQLIALLKEKPINSEAFLSMHSRMVGLQQNLHQICPSFLFSLNQAKIAY